LYRHAFTYFRNKIFKSSQINHAVYRYYILLFSLPPPDNEDDDEDDDGEQHDAPHHAGYYTYSSRGETAARYLVCNKQ